MSHSPSEQELLLQATWAMLVALTLLLGLPLALAADPPTCAPLTTVTFDTDTIHGLLGHWIYIGGASRNPADLKELKEVKYAAFSFYPGSHEGEFNATEIMRLNETCVERNTTKILILWHNSTLVHVSDQVFSMAELIQNDKDLLIMKHVQANFTSLTLSARTHNVTKEQLEEFKAHLHCLGLTEEDTFFTSEKDACPLPGEKTGESDMEPQLG